MPGWLDQVVVILLFENARLSGIISIFIQRCKTSKIALGHFDVECDIQI